MSENSLIPTFPSLLFNTASQARKIATKQVAKILFENDGSVNKEQCQEIFEILYSLNDVRSEISNFFTKHHDPLNHIFIEWVEQEGFTDVIDSIVEKINWSVVVSCAKIPTKLYKKQGPEKSLRLAGEATGKFIVKDKPGAEIAFVYGDSRVFSGVNNAKHNETCVLFIFGYKERVGRYS